MTTVGNNAFESNSALSNVTIPDTVASIGGSAFSGTNLQSMTIPGSVTEIGYQAFGFTNLTSVTIPSSVKTVGSNAFFFCGSLTEVTFQGRETAVLGLTYGGAVYSTAFDGCTSLATIHVPHGAVAHYRGQEGIPSGVTIDAPEEHTYNMVVSNGDGTHSDKCSGCGDTKDPVPCTLALTATAEGNVITVSGSCATCGYSEELGKAVFTFENLVRGNPDAKVSWTQTGPELFYIAVKIDNAGDYAVQDMNEKASYSLTRLFDSTPVTAGDHTLKVLFWDDSGQESNECALPFTVAECPHTGLTFAPVGDGTHTGTYPLCKDVITQDCEYGEYKYDADSHWKTCSVCRYVKEEAHTIGYTAAADGRVITVKKGCTICGHGDTLGTVTVTIPELVYGDLSGVISADISGRLLEDMAVTLQVDEHYIRWLNAQYGNTLSDLAENAVLNVGEHTLRVAFIMEETNKESAGCGLTFTVDPIPLSGKPTFGSGEGKTLGEVEVTYPASWPQDVDFTLTWEAGAETRVVQGTSYAYTVTADNYSTVSGGVILWARPYTPPVDPDQVETEVKVEEGIAEVPEELKNIPELDSPAKLETAMRTSVIQTGIPAQNTAVYDVKLMVSTDGGQTWTSASRENFPADGRLTVTLPYPEGTDSTYSFTVVHMFTTSDFSKTPGDTETPAVTNTANGLRFTVTGLSPISVGWVQPNTPAGPAGGGSGGSVSSVYAVTIEKPEHGKVTSSRTNAGSGSTVTLTVTPDRGYVLDTLTVTDSRGSEIKLTARSDGKYAFTMPGNAVTVKADFAPVDQFCGGGADCPSRGFTDLAAAGTWYHDAVDYVLQNNLMSGYGNGLFGPNDNLSRAQFVQILFNKEGRPVVNYLLQYSDVAAGAWYTEAVRWAASQGIVCGYGNGMFGPNDDITREQLAVMLWRYANQPAATEKRPDFEDTGKISGYALEALRWAVEQGIVQGRGDGILDPKGNATRAEAAAMLMRYLSK